MRVTLEIKSEKAISILEVLKRIEGITVESVNDETLNEKKAAYLSELKKAYHETELSEKGEIELKNFDDLIHEL